MNKKIMSEAIANESQLVSKLKALTEVEIFDFMQSLKGGTYFNMGMYNFIPVSRAYKKTLRIYKVVNLTAIVSGVSYENIGTTKDFRDSTGASAGHAWYDHISGFENKVGAKKSDPSSKYVLWDIKAGSDSWVCYYVVDIATGDVTPVSKSDILASSYLTESEKAKLMPKKVTGFDLTTGAVVENQTNWRTAAFEHIFWLSQAGKTAKEYGMKFTESLNDMKDEDVLIEDAGSELFRDAHANVKTDLDAILSGGVMESVEKEEPYRRIVSRGNTLADNELFVDFDDQSLEEALPSNGYRVVLADYDSDDFDINVEFGFQDPDENEVVDYEYLLKPGQTRGDLVVYLSDNCGFTSIYVHDERPATEDDIKRLASETFPVTNTGDDYRYYGEID